ncbi:MAG: hypothetical protein WAL29_13820, partial [Bacteroidales bacterium]
RWKEILYSFQFYKFTSIIVAMKVHSIIIAVFLLLAASSCKGKPVIAFGNEIDSIGSVWVPDKREGIFEVKLYSSGADLIIKGETRKQLVLIDFDYE